MRLPSFRRTATLVSVSKDSDKGKLVDLGVATLAAGASQQGDLDTSGYTTMIVLARLGNATTPATAAGDLGIFISAWEADGVSTFPAPSGFALTPSATLIAAALSGSVAFAAFRYDIMGIDKIHYQLKNNNVGALQGARLDYYLQA